MRPTDKRIDDTVAEVLRESFEPMDPQAKTAVRERVLHEARAHRRRGVLLTLPRRVAAAAVVATTLTGGLAYATNASLPGDALYPLKRAAENALVALLPSGALERHVLVELAARRAQEASRLEVRGDHELTSETLGEFRKAYEKASGPDGELADDETARIRENVSEQSGATKTEVDEATVPQNGSQGSGQQQPEGSSGPGPTEEPAPGPSGGSDGGGTGGQDSGSSGGGQQQGPGKWRQQSRNIRGPSGVLAL